MGKFGSASAGLRAARVAELAELINTIESSPSGVPPHRFITAKGSQYVLLPDGTTVRYKAARPEHPDPRERGWMERSEHTDFITPEDGNRLSIVQAAGPRRVTLMRHGDTRQLAAGWAKGPQALIPFRGTLVTPSATPAVGLLPLETSRGYTPHFGNPITVLEPEGNWQEWLERAAHGAPPPSFGGTR